MPGGWVFAFPSSTGVTTYETILYDDETLSCNCPGWTYLRGRASPGNPGVRSCKHTRAVTRELLRSTPLQAGGTRVYDVVPPAGSSRPTRSEEAGKTPRVAAPPRPVARANPFSVPAPPAVPEGGRFFDFGDEEEE